MKHAWLFTLLAVAACMPVDTDVDDGGLDTAQPRTLYFGLDRKSGPTEATSLRQLLGNSLVVVLGASVQDSASVNGATFDLTTDTGRRSFGHAIGLDADRALRLAAALGAVESGARDELAKLAMALAEVEFGGSAPVTRMVFSGHNKVGGFHDSVTTGQSNGTIYFHQLTDVVIQFPRASTHVLDLMFSVCMTTTPYNNAADYLPMFPQLLGLWAYHGWSPATPMSDRHILEWAKASRAAHAGRYASLASGRAVAIRLDGENILSLSDNVAIWARDSVTASWQYAGREEPISSQP